MPKPLSHDGDDDDDGDDNNNSTQKRPWQSTLHEQT